MHAKAEAITPLFGADTQPGPQVRGVYCALTLADPDVRPEELAVTMMVPAVPVERTIASTLPENALRLVPLYDAVSVGLPLSTPTIVPYQRHSRRRRALPRHEDVRRREQFEL